MIYPVSANINYNQRSFKYNYQKNNYTQLPFTGVQISENNKDSDNLVFDNNFNSRYEAIKSKYKKMKDSITGFFQKRKLRKIEHDESIALNSFQQSQTDYMNGQDILIQKQKENLELLKKNNASLDEIIDLKKVIEHQEKIKEKMVEIATSKAQKQGFQSIGGYDIEQQILTEMFIKYLPNERAGEYVDFPGCILFFGPNGNGKTSFAKAFANSCGCDSLKSIKGSGRTKEEKQESFYNKLYTAMLDAEAKFEEDRQRTILLVDEFDEYANDDSVILPQLKKLLEKCSNNYHCTIFATTNNPLDIAEEIRNDLRMPIKVFLSPPDFDNIISVLAHYLKDYPHEPLNYDELANTIISKQQKAAYNNSQLEEICNNAYENAIDKITQEDLLYQINITEPGIPEKDLIKFENEKKQINTTELNNDENN